MKIEVPAGLVSGEGSFLGLQMAAISVCFYGLSLVCVVCVGERECACQLSGIYSWRDINSTVTAPNS